MELNELKAKIKSRTVPNFLIFTGDEWEVQKIYIQQIAKDMAYERIDSITDIMSRLTSKAITGRKRSLYIVRDDKFLMSNEKLWDRLDRLLGDNILILLVTRLDKRLKFYNKYKSTIIEFKPLTEAIIKRYIGANIKLSAKNCDQLIQICESNYGRILLEINKIQCYAESKMSYDEAFEQLIQDGTIYKPPKDGIFEFVDAVLDREVQKAYELYEQCKGVGESTLPILTNLFNNTRAVLQVQLCNSKDIGKTTGLNGWQIMNAKKHLDVYDPEELEDLLFLIAECEQGIKTGEIEDAFVIDYILVSIM